MFFNTLLMIFLQQIFRKTSEIKNYSKQFNKKYENNLVHSNSKLT